MNTSGFRACVRELYETRYDPLSVSYAVLTGVYTYKKLSSFMKYIKRQVTFSLREQPTFCDATTVFPAE